ncbi:MAG: glycosyltransferase, partial [Kiritimatiellae bacterium]|nr:glycosyltransferase [Kiritimatiellia bacterium]
MNDLNNMIPCVVFAYNRPRHFQRVLDALRTQGVGHLIVFVDGASNDRDLLGVEACRKVARAVDWIRPELHFDDENHGVSHLAIRVGEVLKRFPKAVFVEDDCLPMPGFYAFMTEALRHYAEEKTVFSVAGYQPIPPRFFRTYPWSAIATHRFICWGWGTWQDRWQTVEALLPNWTKVFDNLKNVPNIAGEDLALAAHQVLAGRTESWAVKVALLTLSRGMVHILPSRGLVKNIGVDEGAHRGQPEFRTRRRAMHNQNVSSSILKHISWPPQTVPDPSFAAEIQRFVREALYPTPTAAMKLRAFGEKVVAYVPQPFKRTARRLLGTLRSISRQNRQQAPLRLVNLGGVGDYSGRNSKPRALLSYVVHPSLVAPSDPMLNCPSPAVRANEMGKVLYDFGYVVDLIDYQ